MNKVGERQEGGWRGETEKGGGRERNKGEQAAASQAIFARAAAPNHLSVAPKMLYLNKKNNGVSFRLLNDTSQ